MANSIDLRQLRRYSEKKQSSKSEFKLESFLNREINFLSKKMPDKVKEAFYMELATLIDAGVDLRSSIEMLIESIKRKHKLLFENLLKDLVNGSSFSEAMNNSKAFSAYEFTSIKIGEETGRLSSILQELSHYYKKKIKQKRQLISALIYPLMVVSVAFIAIMFMMAYVIPMFTDIFKRSGDTLPGITRTVINISEFFRHFGGLFIILSLAPFLLGFYFRKTEIVRKCFSSFILSSPVWGAIIKKVYLARLMNILSMLCDAKIPLVTSLNFCSGIIRFYPLEKSLKEIEIKVTKGMSLNHAMSEYPIFPSKLILMIKAGEETNQLQSFMSRLSDQYSTEIDHQMAVIGKVIEPLIIVILGLFVGVILIAMYLPLFKLGQQF